MVKKLFAVAVLAVLSSACYYEQRPTADPNVKEIWACEYIQVLQRVECINTGVKFNF